jgi:hypothetical protein
MQCIVDERKKRDAEPAEASIRGSFVQYQDHKDTTKLPSWTVRLHGSGICGKAAGIRRCALLMSRPWARSWKLVMPIVGVLDPQVKSI